MVEEERGNRSRKDIEWNMTDYPPQCSKEQSSSITPTIYAILFFYFIVNDLFREGGSES